MAKYLKEDNGQITEQPAATAGGAGNENQIPELDGNGLLPLTMMPVGVGPDTATIVASENIAAGDFVHIWNDGGTPKIRRALADTTAMLADGFVLQPVISGDGGLVYFEGRNTAVVGKTPGTVYYLSDVTPGGVTDTAPTLGNHYVQRIGKAYSATALTTEGLAGPSVKKA